MISFIISTWNSLNFLRPCLESLDGLNLDREVIVVDSNSKDGTREYCENLERNAKLRFISRTRKMPWSEANQIGLDHAKGDWICLSNPDILYNQDFKYFFEEVDKNQDILVAVPQLVYPDGRLQRPAKTITPYLSLCAHTRILRMVLKGQEKSYLYPYLSENSRFPVESPQGSLFMFRREILEKFGGRMWNTGYLNGVSDFDMFLNIRRICVPIWLFPQYKVIHYGSYVSKKSSVGMGWIERDQARGFVLFFRYWNREGKPNLRGWMSPLLYSVLFGLEGFAATAVDVTGRILKRKNPFFNPRVTAWKAGQRFLGIIDGWKFPIST